LVLPALISGLSRLNSESLQSVKRHRFAPGSEPQVFTGNFCGKCEVKCPARGSRDLYPGFRQYDPEIIEGAMARATVSCVCLCPPEATATA